MCSPINWLSLSSKRKENVNLALLWDWKKKKRKNFQVFLSSPEESEFLQPPPKISGFFLLLLTTTMLWASQREKFRVWCCFFTEERERKCLMYRILLKLQLIYWIRLRNLYMLIGICFWTFFALVLDILTGHLFCGMLPFCESWVFTLYWEIRIKMCLKRSLTSKCLGKLAKYDSIMFLNDWIFMLHI